MIFPFWTFIPWTFTSAKSPLAVSYMLLSRIDIRLLVLVLFCSGHEMLKGKNDVKPQTTTMIHSQNKLPVAGPTSPKSFHRDKR